MSVNIPLTGDDSIIRIGKSNTVGEITEVGAAYYFKIQPIKWRVLEDKDGIAFLITEDAIDTKQYNNSDTTPDNSDAPIGTSASNYQYSGIRQWLTTVFFEQAIEKYLINLEYYSKYQYLDKYIKNPFLQKTTLHDSNNIQDILFLLSEVEANDINYFSSENNRIRAAYTSDYAVANSGFRRVATGSSYKCTRWWLRTSASANSVYRANENGATNNANTVNLNYITIRPAIRI